MILTLTALRYRALLSQSELARLTKLSQPPLSNYERGLEILPEHADRLLHAILKKMGAGATAFKYISHDDLGKPWQEVESERSSD